MLLVIAYSWRPETVGRTIKKGWERFQSIVRGKNRRYETAYETQLLIAFAISELLSANHHCPVLQHTRWRRLRLTSANTDFMTRFVPLQNTDFYTDIIYIGSYCRESVHSWKSQVLYKSGTNSIQTTRIEYHGVRNKKFSSCWDDRLMPVYTAGNFYYSDVKVTHSTSFYIRGPLKYFRNICFAFFKHACRAIS